MIRFLRHINLVMSLNKIIDEMNKENELMKTQILEFRNRAIKAEAENERLNKLLGRFAYKAGSSIRSFEKLFELINVWGILKFRGWQITKSHFV